MNFWNVAIALFLIMDPFGNCAPVLKLTDRYTLSKQRAVIAREIVFALITMLIFYLIGEFLFRALQLSEASVRLTAGMILFLTALRILYPNEKGLRDNLGTDEPYLTPIAIPLIAGPSLTATIMLYAHLEPNHPKFIVAMCTALAAAFITLFFSRALNKMIGANGLLAFEKLMGMILVLLAIQRFFEGIRLVIESIVQ